MLNHKRCFEYTIKTAFKDTLVSDKHCNHASTVCAIIGVVLLKGPPMPITQAVQEG